MIWQVPQMSQFHKSHNYNLISHNFDFYLWFLEQHSSTFLSFWQKQFSTVDSGHSRWVQGVIVGSFEATVTRSKSAPHLQLLNCTNVFRNFFSNILTWAAKHEVPAPEEGPADDLQTAAPHLRHFIQPENKL